MARLTHSPSRGFDGITSAHVDWADSKAVADTVNAHLRRRTPPHRGPSRSAGVAENCRQLDPQTRIVLVCRLDVSPAETPRWRRIQFTGSYLWPRGEPRILDMCEGARIEERVLLPDSFSLLRMGPAADLPA
jgi:hypothetical protein